MADTALFKETEANTWKGEVDNLLKLVKNLLDEVARELSTQPEEDDTIMTGLHKAGETLNTVWTALGEQFRAVIDGIQKVIDNLVEGVKKGVETINDFFAGN